MFPPQTEKMFLWYSNFSKPDTHRYVLWHRWPGSRWRRMYLANELDQSTVSTSFWSLPFLASCMSAFNCTASSDNIRPSQEILHVLAVWGLSAASRGLRQLTRIWISSDMASMINQSMKLENLCLDYRLLQNNVSGTNQCCWLIPSLVILHAWYFRSLSSDLINELHISYCTLSHHVVHFVSTHFTLILLWIIFMMHHSPFGLFRPFQTQTQRESWQMCR